MLKLQFENSTFKIFAAILVASKSSSELFIPATGETCDLPGFSFQRTYHTVDYFTDRNYLGSGTDSIAVVCGTEYYGVINYNSKKCEMLDLTTGSGSWRRASSTSSFRTGQSSWVSSAGLVLMGGSDGGMSTTEIWPDGGANFTLNRSIK